MDFFVFYNKGVIVLLILIHNMLKFKNSKIQMKDQFVKQNLKK